MIAPLSLFFLASAPSLAAGLWAPATVAPLPQQDPAPAARLATLLEEYALARKAWVAEIQAAEPDQGVEILQRIPSRTFWERFAALAQEGLPGAWQWMAQNARDAGQPRVEVCSQALAAAGSSPGVVNAACDALESVPEPEEERAVEVLAAALATIPDAGSQARVALAMGILMGRSGDSARRAEGLELLRALAAEHDGQELGQRAADEVFRLEHLTPGALAPDFEGRTIDGAPLKLSQHRGKIAVVDFFGFW